MKLIVSTILVTLLALSQFAASAQEIKKFTYGGNGGRSNGTFAVQYYIQDGDKKYPLDKVSDPLDLNEFKNKIQFQIEISDLKLGLNNAFNKVRNSDHPKAYYLEISRLNIGISGLKELGADTLKISSGNGHYGAHTGSISYLIDSLPSKKHLLFQVKTRIINGVYGRKWKGVTVSKKINVIPKTPEVKEIVTVSEEADTAENQRPLREWTNRFPSDNTNRSEKEKEEETIEDKFWDKIEQDLIADDKQSVLERCKVYLKNCEMKIFQECKKHEDVLFYMASFVPKDEKKTIINQYKELYPSGKYLDQLDTLIKQPIEVSIPIKEGYAKLDFDHNALLVNRVIGGNKPYYVGFFDTEKNKNYAVKQVRFAKENFYIDLNTLEIPEGNYHVKITDSKGRLFTKTNDVYVSQLFTIPNSLKVTVILILVCICGFLYKKYIYF